MGHFRKTALAAGILFLTGVSVVAPAAAATFDGAWNVQIASTNMACPSGTSVSIGINNGQVASNNAMVTASGRVAEAGAISVTLISGIKRATGYGHLNATSGSGTWRGALCSGTWTAQRI
jgi:predicted alpha/beta hydrolase family esterase